MTGKDEFLASVQGLSATHHIDGTGLALIYHELGGKGDDLGDHRGPVPAAVNESACRTRTDPVLPAGFRLSPVSVHRDAG